MDHKEFARFTEGLDYPLHLVTTASGDERSGCIVGFGSQVSIKPPRMLVGISVENHTHGVVGRADAVAVHLLASAQRDLATLFGGETGDEIDKFSQCGWQPGPGGVPVLDDCPRVMIGRILERLDLGDHTGLLLEPVSVEVRPGEPTLTLADLDGVEPGHSA